MGSRNRDSLGGAGGCQFTETQRKGRKGTEEMRRRVGPGKARVERATSSAE